MNQQPHVLHSHPSQDSAGISIQLEQLNDLLNNLETKLNTLDIAEKVKHLQAIDTFFAKSNQHLSAIEALSTKDSIITEIETMEMTNNPIEDYPEDIPKQADILEIERLLESSSYPENVFDYTTKELEQLNSAIYRSSERL
jgi:hypothetical protein